LIQIGGKNETPFIIFLEFSFSICLCWYASNARLSPATARIVDRPTEANWRYTNRSIQSIENERRNSTWQGGKYEMSFTQAKLTINGSFGFGF
jgi:hypothetical protein